MPRPLIALVLLLGIAAVSTASVLVRFAQPGAPSLAIAAGRLGIATLLLAPAALARHGDALARLGRRELGLALLAGVFLATHFATWIASLEHTTVASSVVLVTTTPVWVAIASPWLLGERAGLTTWIGIACAFAGAATIGWGDSSAAAPHPAFGRGALRGDLLALAGAWAMAGYLLAGRRLRARLPLLGYVFVVYGAAALALGVALALAGPHPPAIAPRAWVWIALLALVPQLLGHSSFNWALRHLPATIVSVALLGEPVGSTVIAWRVLGEVPGPVVLLGAALTLAGVAIAARGAGGAIGRAGGAPGG